MHGDGARGVLFILAERTFSQTKRVEKRANVQVALGIEQVDIHRREIRALAVLFDGIVGSEKSCGGNDAVEDHQDDEPFREFATLRHFALAAARMRGSAQ
jgi:hypothetical protein